MAEQYSVMYRYQYRSKNGIEWTSWATSFVSNFFNSKKDAEAYLNEEKSRVAEIDKKTKLKHEYKIAKIEMVDD